MLAVRLICAVGTPCCYAETIVEAECAGQKFRTKGKTVTDMGWRQYAGKPVEETEKNAEAGELPILSEGMTLELAGVDLKAVSYTHLDVYKRQSECRLICQPQSRNRCRR